jgi:bifunctional UDP-N-acetylglucosamine pyrophosphorylase / glucosamine-1-phosphate N-acetyltransferase
MGVAVVVLAAGQGKRMRSERPKVLHPLAGRPLLAHVLDRAFELTEPGSVHVVHGHGADRVRAAFADAGVRWVLQAEQLGTGHAVAQAISAISDGDRVVVLCGDVPLVAVESLRRLAETRSGLALLTARLSDPTGYGRVLRNADGAVERIVEDKDATPAQRNVTEINSGLMALEAADLKRWIARLSNNNAQGEYYLTDVIGMAVGEGVRVEGIEVADPQTVLGINDKAQLAAAERTFQRAVADRLLTAGVTLADPARVDVRGELIVGRDVFIDVNVVFEGRVVLGDGVTIGAGSVIADSTLGAETRVHALTMMSGIATGERCELGPFARLRPGADLAAAVKVGNFVEIKNSRVEQGSKINHLTYIGDAMIGTGVNIGAGTITCNYDGAAKHRTTIGDDVFIGSGVMLVAPIEIGAGATIGAGSTLSKDAPAGELTLARSRQTTIPGWQRPRKPAK